MSASDRSASADAADGITVDSDPARLDLAVIHRFLSTESYWAQGIPLELVRRSIAGSLCFGVYDGDRQVGFARLITDRATFAYLADVFVLESHRGRGLSRRLMDAVVAHPDVQGLRRWLLVTRDAQGVYAGYGFAPLVSPHRFMERYDADAYQAAAALGDAAPVDSAP